VRIQRRVARLLGLRPAAVGLKAKTPEGLGTYNAAIAQVAVLLEKDAPPIASKARTKRKKK
jgi:2-C-methyl-D-erythritol 2,4-cyclodiphosphate synthase